MPEKPVNSKSRRLWLLPVVLIVLAACSTGAIREKILTLPVIEGATYVGQETCEGCHEDYAVSFAKSIHGRLANFEFMGAEKGCESCHGPGSLHAEEGDNSKILRYSELNAEESAAVCVKCHSDGMVMDWTFSEHALSDLSCTDCHSVHASKATASLKASDPQLCYGCHQEQQAKANLPSHHPVKEGKMNCSDCHNAHGELQTEEQARDLCLKCHSRYQGPFVFEHAPVEEDCSICHDPHGTVANNLLQQNEPFLCLQCHESHFHATRLGGTASAANVAFSATNPDGSLATAPTPGTKPAAGTATPAPTGGSTPKSPLGAEVIPITNELGEHSWQLAFGTKCTVCHGVVHGSDLPSQSAPSVTNPASSAGNGDGQGWPDGGGGLTR